MFIFLHILSRSCKCSTLINASSRFPERILELGPSEDSSPPATSHFASAVQDWPVCEVHHCNSEAHAKMAHYPEAGLAWPHKTRKRKARVKSFPSADLLLLSSFIRSLLSLPLSFIFLCVAGRCLLLCEPLPTSFAAPRRLTLRRAQLSLVSFCSQLFTLFTISYNQTEWSTAVLDWASSCL